MTIKEFVEFVNANKDSFDEAFVDGVNGFKYDMENIEGSKHEEAFNVFISRIGDITVENVKKHDEIELLDILESFN